MLKKLIKYGNSNALVLDKALLELLNISEGATVKIKTDGHSLIISPASEVVAQKQAISTTPEETYRNVMSSRVMENLEAIKQSGDQGAVNSLNKAISDANNPDSLMSQEMNKLLTKHKKAIDAIAHSTELFNELARLKSELEVHGDNDRYLKEVVAMRHVTIPGLKELDEDMLKLNEEFSLKFKV